MELLLVNKTALHVQFRLTQGNLSGTFVLGERSRFGLELRDEYCVTAVARLPEGLYETVSPVLNGRSHHLVMLRRDGEGQPPLVLSPGRVTELDVLRCENTTARPVHVRAERLYPKLDGMLGVESRRSAVFDLSPRYEAQVLVNGITTAPLALETLHSRVEVYVDNKTGKVGLCAKPFQNNKPLGSTQGTKVKQP